MRWQDGYPCDSGKSKLEICINDIGKYIEYDSKTGTLKWIDHYHPVHRSILVGRTAGSLSKRGYLEVTFLYKKIRWNINLV